MMEKAVDFTALCLHLTPEEKLKLFDMLCDAHDGKRQRKRLPERISQDLGIPRTHVYRYLPREGKKRRIPSAETTAKIINALRALAFNQSILPILKVASDRMLIEARAYHHWIRGIEHRTSPFSLSEIEKLEWSCGR